MNRIVKFHKFLLRNRNLISRKFHEEFQTKEPPVVKKLKSSAPGAISTKYEIFQESDSQIILDIDEERQRIADGIIDVEYDKPKIREVYLGVNLESK